MQGCRSDCFASPIFSLKAYLQSAWSEKCLLTLQRNRATLSREEQELIDVERQMEEQLVQQHMELERVVAIRTEPNTEGGVGYLCKWRGLPYSEATWENKDMIQKMDNGAEMAQAYQVRHSVLPKQAL